MFSGSANDTLETFKEILSDIDSVQLSLGREAVSSQIISKIKNTMSDRHAAEKLFNELLKDFRADILPTIIEKWDELAVEEKEQLTRMNNFFCGLHYLVGLAECSDKTVSLWEASLSENESSHTSSSGTQRLIRTACKTFHHRGSQQCGTSTLFRSYMKQKGIFKLPLAQFIGNRFNILFYDAAGLQHHMVQFLQSVHGKNMNRLLQSVLDDLNNPILIAGYRALGLIDKIVTGPLWRRLEESSVSVLDMSYTYCQLKVKFDTWANDSSTLIDGSARCINDDVIHDDVWRALVRPDSSDTMTQELLQLLFNTFSVTTQRLLIDHLLDGIHHNVTDETIVQEIASVPTTNVSPERDFAVLDRYLREKPNAQLISLEAMFLFAHNKTSFWIAHLSSDERKEIFQAARKLAPEFKEKFKIRREEIERKHTRKGLKKIVVNS